MNLFRRAIRFFLIVAGLVAAVVAAATAFFLRYLLRPPRQPLWATPEDAGMPFEEVEFPARDGLRLSGWFIPAGASTPQPRATVILVHGWPWNRLGEAGDNLLANISAASPVDLLRLAHSIHHAGYHVLMFDLRNHGQSASSGAVTFGLREANDLLGAIDYLSGRGDVAQDKLGAVGFSMGANTVLYALPRTNRLRAAVAVQPTSVQVFARRFAVDLMGPLGQPTLTLVDAAYEQLSGLHLAAIEPVFAAAGAGDTPVLYVQGHGDQWGSVSNVAHMASVTPHAVGPLIVDSVHRYGGYRAPIDQPEALLDFLREHLS